MAVGQIDNRKRQTALADYKSVGRDRNQNSMTDHYDTSSGFYQTLRMIKALKNYPFGWGLSAK